MQESARQIDAATPGPAGSEPVAGAAVGEEPPGEAPLDPAQPADVPSMPADLPAAQPVSTAALGARPRAAGGETPHHEVPGRARGAAAGSELAADDPLFRPVRERDLTFWIALGIVLLLHAGFLAASIRIAGEEAAERERRGQVERSETVTVELVEEPDPDSRSKRSQSGADAPPAPFQPPAQPPPPPPPRQQAQPEPQPPAPEQASEPPAAEVARAEPPPDDPSLAAPQPAASAPTTEPPKTEPAKPEARKPEPAKPQPPRPKPAEASLSLDDFDLTMDEYARAVDRAQAQRRASADAQRLKGAAPVGRQSEYSKAVIAALAKTKPKSYLTRGSVYVGFELTPSGQLRVVRVLQTSGDPLLDQLGVDAIKKATFPVPPQGTSVRDLTYVIHYRFD